METGLVIKNFVEATELVRPICRDYLHFTELVKFTDEIETDCQCDKMGRINRALNYYRRWPEILSLEEKEAILKLNSGKKVVFFYQNEPFFII